MEARVMANSWNPRRTGSRAMWGYGVELILGRLKTVGPARSRGFESHPSAIQSWSGPDTWVTIRSSITEHSFHGMTGGKVPPMCPVRSVTDVSSCSPHLAG